MAQTSEHLLRQQISVVKFTMVSLHQGPRARLTASRSFPFLKLPAEVRLFIYKHALKGKQPIQVRRTARPSFEGTTTRSGRHLRPRLTAEEVKRACGTSTLALTATCRLIYLEAVDLYYASNAFECCATPDLPDFLASIGTASMNVISEIRFHMRNNDDLATLEQMPGLRTLRLVLRSGCPHCDPDQVQDRPRDWFEYAVEQLWNFCTRRPGLEKVGLLRDSSWVGTSGYSRLRDLEYEISAMNEYLKQMKEGLAA